MYQGPPPPLHPAPPGGEMEAPGGRGCDPLRGSLAGEAARLGQMGTVLGSRGLGLSTSRIDGLNPQHNLLLIPTLQRGKLRPHSGSAEALALRDTGFG